VAGAVRLTMFVILIVNTRRITDLMKRTAGVILHGGMDCGDTRKPQTSDLGFLVSESRRPVR